VRNPWTGEAGDAELEALQTDVMRFVAILGLCLAAIFSLVQRASLEQPPPVLEVPAPEPQSTTEPAAKPTVVEHAVEPAPEPVPAPADPPEQVGFSLEFASAADLMQLLESGQLQLYAQTGEQFWSADARGRFSPVEAPRSYYQMDAATVPEALLGSLQRAGPAGDPVWGVVLAPEIVAQLTRLMAEATGGNLLIRGNGRVDME